MSEQHDLQQHDGQNEHPLSISREQIIAVGGTLLTSGIIDLATHFNPGYTLAGLVAAYAAGKLTPELMRILVPGSNPQATIAATKAVVDRLAPESAERDKPQDALSKLKRLAGIKSGEPGRPKDESFPHPQDDQAEKEEEQSADASSIGPIAIPQAPKFSEMSHLILPHRLVLCWTVDGPVYGTVEDLLSMVIVGKPGRGKTTALIYYVAMLLKAGAEVHVWDPHGSMSELNDAFPGLYYTDDLEDIPANIEMLRSELEARRKLYKRTKQVKHPLLLLVDELPVIGEYNRTSFKGVDENLTPIKVISDFVLQARKWNCYFIGAGQSTDAEILPTRVTENLSSRIIFYSSVRRATMAGIDAETAKKFLPVLKPDDVKGKMIFDCSRFSEPVLGAIPSITISDVQHFLGRQPLPDAIDEDDDDIPVWEEPVHQRQAPTITTVVQPKEENALTQNASELEKITRLFETDKIDLDTFARLLDKLQLTDSDVSRPLEIEQPNLRLVPQQEPLSPELQKALEVYQSGITDYRSVGREIGCGKDKAGELIQELRRRKLV